MNKICLSSRDELLIIDLDKVAFFKANGNYTELSYMTGQKVMMSLGLAKAEELIKKSLPKENPSSFVKLGRSIIINEKFLTHISTLKQKVILSDGGDLSYSISIPKQLLRKYKELINKKFNQ